jgi:thiosulfate/3-mercaptopyruvate sulfurtransferase
VDGTWFHKGNRSGRDEFEGGPRICGAHYLDPVDIATTKEMFPLLNKEGLWAMLPTADLFALTMDEFGIQNDSHVVVYGKEGALFTPRTWFMFKHFGHGNVSLMQASLEEWMDAGGAVDTNRVQVPYAKDILLKAKSKRPSYQCSTTIRNDVVDMDRMKQLVGNDNAIIIDPRSSSFSKGHMPGAYNIPYSSLVQEDNALKLKSKEKLLEIFEKAGIDIYDSSKEIVASCGSGVSACTVMLALEECGRTDNTYMYDGSWQEWKLDPTTPKVLPADQ